MFAAFEFADPAEVDVVGGEVPAGVELVEGVVDRLGQFCAGQALARPQR
jgi:hypothetical protein